MSITYDWRIVCLSQQTRSIWLPPVIWSFVKPEKHRSAGVFIYQDRRTFVISVDCQETHWQNNWNLYAKCDTWIKRTDSLIPSVAWTHCSVAHRPEWSLNAKWMRHMDKTDESLNAKCDTWSKQTDPLIPSVTRRKKALIPPCKVWHIDKTNRRISLC